jgi:hypothetical protein
VIIYFNQSQKCILKTQFITIDKIKNCLHFAIIPCICQIKNNNIIKKKSIQCYEVTLVRHNAKNIL